MLLDQGRIVEFDRCVDLSDNIRPSDVQLHSPFALLGNSNSRFFALCKATGKDEFAVLKQMAGL